MTQVMSPQQPTLALNLERLTDGERVELQRMGLLSDAGEIVARPEPLCHTSRPPMAREATSVPQVLNEAYDYAKPSSFARALSFTIADATVLLISGTASVDDEGRTLYTGDFRAQCWRTYRNITAILEANDMSWHDIVRTTCYLRDIERDYAAFNEVRTAFFDWQQLDPLPASTGIQTRLCREDLLIEIEAIAVAKFGGSR
jgi:enamine deaminase RidA (YjgF/YER057c/UK114 family)